MKKNKKLMVLTSLSVLATMFAIILSYSSSQSLEVPASGCEHKGTVNHHERVEPTLLKPGVKEYWCCCDCHKSFEDKACTKQILNTEGDPSEVSDGRYLAPIGETLNENYSKGTLVDQTAPNGFSKVYEKADNQQGQFLFRDDSYIQNYEKVTFAVKSSSKWFSIDGWGVASYESQVWKIFELVQTDVDVWSVYSSNVGAQLALKKSNVSGSTIKAVMAISGAQDTYYATEVKVLRNSIDDKMIDKSMISANGAVTTPSTNFDAPAGFEKVNDYDTGLSDKEAMHGKFYSGVSLVAYSEVRFALRCTGYFLFNHSWKSNYEGPNKWFVFTLTQNNDLTWNLVAKLLDGTLVYSEDNLNGFVGDNPGVYTNYALNAILYGCPSGFCASKQDGVDLIVSVTEVRGTRFPSKGTLIDSCALSANNIVTTKLDIEAPIYFDSVYKATVDVGQSVSFDKYFSAVDLRNYSEVHFMCNARGWFLFDGWSRYIDSDEWVYVTLINKGNDLFDITYETSSKEIQDTNGNKYGKTYTKENVNSAAIVTNCTIGALNTLFTKANVSFQNGKEIYVTEMRAYKNIVTSPVINPKETGNNIDKSYKIIYEDNGDKNIKKTADDIHYLFGLATNWSFELIPEASVDETFSASSKVISIGNTSFYKTSGESFENPDADSYMVKTVGNSILINATYTNGFIPASYYFLEKTVGFKTYSIKEDVYYKTLTNIPLLDFKSEITPTISMRDIVTHSDNMKGSEKNALGFTSDLNEPYTLTSNPHSLTNQFLNYDKYKSSHPKWYCDNLDDGIQLCYSAHGDASEYLAMKNQLVEEIKPLITDHFTSEPNHMMAYVYLCISDNWNYCTCDACEDEFTKYGSYAGQQLHFVSEIADLIESWMGEIEEYKDKVIKFPMLSYQQCQDPGIVNGYTLNKNVIVYFAPVKADFSIGFSSTENSEYYNQLVGWSNLLHDNGLYENLWVWAYSTPANCYMLPSSDFEIVSSQYKTFASLGVKRVMVESIYSTHSPAFEDLNVYLKGKLLSWADYDFDTLVTDFMAHYYDNAATNVKKYYDLLTGVIKANKVKGSIWDTADNKDYWSVSDLKTMLTYLSDALTDADSIVDADRKTLIKDRINRERCTVLYMVLSYYPTANEWSKTELTSFINDFETYTTKFGITQVSYKETVATRIETFRNSIKQLVA